MKAESAPQDATGFDVVVIGSGFGGAVAAHRLVRAGLRVLVLERGPWRDTLPVRSAGIAPRAPLPYGRSGPSNLLHSVHGRRFRLRLARSGLFELGLFAGLRTLAVSSVGGGSIAWGGLLEPPRNVDLWRDRHPLLAPGDIEQHYPALIEALGGLPFARDPALPQTVWDAFADRADTAVVPSPVQPRVALLLPGTPQPTGAAGIQRRPAAFDGDGFLGSLGGAKASVDFVFLAPLLARGLSLRASCEVESLRPAGGVPGTGYEVRYRDHERGRTETVVAPRVVLAAGTLNTLRLLFKSSSMAGGLAAMPALGRNVYANGDLIGVGVRPASAATSFRATPFMGDLRVSGHEDTPIGVGGLPGFDSWPLPAVLRRLLARTLLVFGMGADSATATGRWSGGRLDLDYDPHREPIYARLRAAFARLGSASGWKIRALGTPLSPHVGGGARLGRDAQHGVVDHRGEVYGNPGLHVADAAALPAAPGGPPSLSVAAWACQVADGIASRSSAVAATGTVA